MVNRAGVVFEGPDARLRADNCIPQALIQAQGAWVFFCHVQGHILIIPLLEVIFYMVHQVCADAHVPPKRLDPEGKNIGAMDAICRAGFAAFQPVGVG